MKKKNYLQQKKLMRAALREAERLDSHYVAGRIYENIKWLNKKWKQHELGPYYSEWLGELHG